MNIIRIDLDLIVQIVLQFWLVMDGTGEKKHFSMGLESRIPDSLEEGLSLGKERVVVQVISDPAVPREDLLLL